LPPAAILDIISYKVPITASEYFLELTKDSNSVRMEYSDFASFNGLADSCEKVLKLKMQELTSFRGRGRVLTDNKYDIYTMFLEAKIGAGESSGGLHVSKLLSLGDAALISYVQ
jgi:hypothetical protein